MVAAASKGPARFSFTTAIPGVAQFASSPTVFVGADTADELVENLASLLQAIEVSTEENARADAEASLARFFTGAEVVMAQIPGTQEIQDNGAAQSAPVGPVEVAPQPAMIPQQPAPVAAYPQPVPPQQFAQPQQQAWGGGQAPQQQQQPQGFMKPCAACQTPRSRGPLSGQYGPWFGCPNPACPKGPRQGQS